VAELRVELGFEGGGVLRCDIAAAAFDALLTAFAEKERSPLELVVDGDRAVVDLARVVYVRQLRSGRAISFADTG
jgi:hypothetical protein